MTVITFTTGGGSFTLNNGVSRSWRWHWCYSCLTGAGLVASCILNADGSYTKSFGFLR